MTQPFDSDLAMDAYFDGELDAEQEAALRAWLAEDPQRGAQMLAERSLLHSRLALIHAQAFHASQSKRIDAADTVALAGRGARFHNALNFLTRRTPLSIAVAALFIGLLITAMAFIAAPIYRQLTGSGREPADDAAPVIVAQLSGMHEAVWAEGQIGTRQGANLPAGHRLELTAGLAEVTFSSGAKVVIDAPAVVRIDGPLRCSIEAGKLVGRVPASAVGFTVHAPHATIIDLGTEFAVVVDGRQTTEVHVIKGSVEVAAIDRTARILTAGQALAIDETGSRSIAALPETEFARLPASLQGRFAGASPALVYSRMAPELARADGAFTVGMLFEVSDVPLEVTHLGVQDVDAVVDDPDGEDGLTGFADADGFHAEQVDEQFAGMQVGLWSGDGSTLLASARVKSGDPILGSWRFAELQGEPLVLEAGQQYLLGAFVGGGLEWFLDHAERPAASIPFRAGRRIRLVENRHRAGEFGPPLAPGQGQLGRWGAANALFKPMQAVRQPPSENQVTP